VASAATSTSSCHTTTCMSKISTNDCILRYLQCTGEMYSANNSDPQWFEVAHENLIKDSEWVSNHVNTVLWMSPWQTYQFQIKLRVSILLHMIKSHSHLAKQNICRMLLLQNTQVTNKLSPHSIPHINSMMTKTITIATVIFAKGITISQCIDNLIF